MFRITVLKNTVHSYLNQDFKKQRPLHKNIGIIKRYAEYKLPEILLIDYNVRKQQVQDYDSAMIGTVMVPSINEKQEYYMSRTNTGTDYLTKEADYSLSQGNAVDRDIIDNNDIIAKVNASTADEGSYKKADELIKTVDEELKQVANTADTTDKEYIKHTTKDYLTFTEYTGSGNKMFILETVIGTAVVFFIILCAVYYVIDGYIRRRRTADMNKFNLLKYLSKWKYLIFAVCVLGALIVYKYAMYNQEYTASTVISYTGQNAADGKTPSGDDIDVTEIYSAAVITNVLEDLNLNIGADAIRSKCKVTEIIPPDEEVKKQALLEAGEEYTYFPTDYVVSFSVGSEYSQDFARTVLDSIIKNYFATYGEKYINQQTLPNNNVRGTDGQYDYIERVEILDAWALNISDYLAAKKETQPNYRSAETGYSFSDLYEIYKSYIDYDIPQIYSLILEQEVTGDKETLIKKYQSDISTYELDLQNMERKSTT